LRNDALDLDAERIDPESLEIAPGGRQSVKLVEEAH
jgi:hypothetical protein